MFCVQDMGLLYGSFIPFANTSRFRGLGHPGFTQGCPESVSICCKQVLSWMVPGQMKDKDFARIVLDC